jgi:hypothetical protein
MPNQGDCFSSLARRALRSAKGNRRRSLALSASKSKAQSIALASHLRKCKIEHGWVRNGLNVLA